MKLLICPPTVTILLYYLLALDYTKSDGAGSHNAQYTSYDFSPSLGSSSIGFDDKPAVRRLRREVKSPKLTTPEEDEDAKWFTPVPMPADYEEPDGENDNKSVRITWKGD